MDARRLGCRFTGVVTVVGCECERSADVDFANVVVDISACIVRLDRVVSHGRSHDNYMHHSLSRVEKVQARCGRTLLSVGANHSLTGVTGVEVVEKRREEAEATEADDVDPSDRFGHPSSG